jgi:tetratricopeptide (TPR) repeat protein
MPLPRSVRRVIHGCLFALPMGTALARPAFAEGEPKDIAREHYSRGVALANAGSYDQALAEFTRAYELVPHYAVLYNVGQAYLELGRTVKAVESLEQYLRLGAASIQPERRQQVEAELAALSAELAAIQLTVDEEGAQISLDGEPLGHAPLSSPLRVSAGRHTLAAVSASGRRLEQTLQLARGETRPIALRFRQAKTKPAVFGFMSVNPAPPRTAPDTAARSTTQRTFGYALGAVGLGLGGAALAHWRWNDGRYEDWQSAYADYGRNPAASRSELDAINAQAESIERAGVVTVSLGVAALLSFGAGVVLLVTDGNDSDRAASSRRAWQRASSQCKSPLVGFCSRW